MISYDNVLGNQILKQQLLASVRNGIIQHAYIFCGENGLGKENLTRAFVSDIFCFDRGSDGACGKCPQCKKTDTDNHPDVIYTKYDKESIGVDVIRTQINDSIYIKPYEGQRKVYIIKDADKMTAQAQNALLKTLEEPPEYAIIILVCQDEKKLLETIRSRAVVFRLKQASDIEIREYLIKIENADEMQAETCTAFAKGNLGKALDLLRDKDFLIWYKRAVKILRTIKQMNIIQIKNEIIQLLEECTNIYEALDTFQLWYRDMYIYKTTKNINSLFFTGERKSIVDMSGSISESGIRQVMNDIEKCRIRLQANVNRELALELLFLSMKEN